MIFYDLLSNGKFREVGAINLLGAPTKLYGMSVVAAGNCREVIEATKPVMPNAKEHAIS